MPIPQRALSLGLAAIRRLNSAWGRLTLRKVIVVSIAVMTAVAALMNAFGVFILLVLPCAMLLLLIWGVSRLFGLLGLSKWSENTRVALALAVVVGFFLFCGFMATPERHVFRHAEMKAEIKAEMQEVMIERNKVRIGMTINDVLPLVHGMDISAEAESVWLSVLPDNKRFDYSPASLDARQHPDGTFTVSCHCGSAQVSRNSRVTESQAAALTIQQWQPKQVLQNLTASQAAELMKRKMSDFDWTWQYTSRVKSGRQYFFAVSFGRDGRVNAITDVHPTDLSPHRS